MSAKSQLPSLRCLEAIHFRPVATASSLAAVPPYFFTSAAFALALRPAVALSSFTVIACPTSAASSASDGSRSFTSSGISVDSSATFSLTMSAISVVSSSSSSDSGISIASKIGASSGSSLGSPRMLKIWSRVSLSMMMNVNASPATTWTSTESPQTPRISVSDRRAGGSSSSTDRGAARSGTAGSGSDFAPAAVGRSGLLRRAGLAGPSGLARAPSPDVRRGDRRPRSSTALPSGAGAVGMAAARRAAERPRAVEPARPGTTPGARRRTRGLFRPPRRWTLE